MGFFLPRPCGDRAGLRGAGGSGAELYSLRRYARAVKSYVRRSVVFICHLHSRVRVKGLAACGFLPRPCGERAEVRGAGGSGAEPYSLRRYARAVKGYVRQSVVFICHLHSRERVKGRRRLRRWALLFQDICTGGELFRSPECCFHMYPSFTRTCQGASPPAPWRPRLPARKIDPFGADHPVCHLASGRS